jgi:hypothetical protein
MIEHYFTCCVGEMMKTAARTGEAEKYLPWYGSTTLGGLGAAAAQSLTKKHKLPAAIAGSLAGTVAGVHGGEALGRRLDRLRRLKEKTGEEKTVPRIMGEGLLGFGAGALTGYGAGRLLEKGIRGVGKSPLPILPRVLGTAGAVGGMSYPLWKAYEQDAIRRALEERRKKLEKERGK